MNLEHISLTQYDSTSEKSHVALGLQRGLTGSILGEAHAVSSFSDWSGIGIGW